MLGHSWVRRGSRTNTLAPPQWPSTLRPFQEIWSFPIFHFLWWLYRIRVQMVWKCWRAPSIHAFNGYTFVLCWLSSPKWFPVASSLKSRKCFPSSPHLSQLLTLHLMHILESISSTSPIPSCFEVNICGEVLTCNNLWIVFAQDSCFFHLVVVTFESERSLCSYALCFEAYCDLIKANCLFMIVSNVDNSAPVWTEPSLTIKASKGGKYRLK